MPDLNKLMEMVKSDTDSTKKAIEKLLISYDALFRECNTQYISDKMASNGEVDHDFYNLVHLIKRNRDVVGSLMRGIRGIRGINGYKFIEEDIPTKKEAKIDERALSEMTIPTEEPDNG